MNNHEDCEEVPVENQTPTTDDETLFKRTSSIDASLLKIALTYLDGALDVMARKTLTHSDDGNGSKSTQPDFVNEVTLLCQIVEEGRNRVIRRIKEGEVEGVDYEDGDLAKALIMGIEEVGYGYSSDGGGSGSGVYKGLVVILKKALFVRGCI